MEYSEERIKIPEEKFEDYTLEQLEVKKRITEEKIQERIEFSIPYRIQNRIGIDVYKLAKYLFIIQIIIIVIGFLYFYIPILMNSTSNVSEVTPVFLAFIYIMVFTMLPTGTLIFVDQTAPMKRKLKEINRVIRIKQDVAHGDRFELIDENEKREYKSSFKYDYNTKSANNDLSKTIVHSVLGFLNSNGGNLVIGVNDDKKVLGIEKDLQFFKGSWDKYQLAIYDLLRKYTDKSVSEYVLIKKIEIDGKQICLISSKRYPKPVFYIEGGNQELFIRDGNSTIKLPMKKALEYIESHWIDKKS